jgi:hypothetical protein
LIAASLSLQSVLFVTLPETGAQELTGDATEDPYESPSASTY